MHRKLALSFTLLLVSAPVAAHTPKPLGFQDNSAACAAAAPKKKKGFGLGGLLSAARRAGVGDMLTGRAGNLLGGGKGGQIVGAVAGTALGGAGGGSGGLGGMVPGMGGQGGAAQVASAVTGMALEAARSTAPASACTPN